MPVALLYHDVTPAGQEDVSGFPGAGAARYKLTPEDYAAHLDAISQATTLAPLACAPTLHGKSQDWMMTFDDGGTSSIHPIADELEERGWRGWFFITTDRLDTPGFLTRSELRELYQRGHLIGSHSCSHPLRLSHCSPEQQLAEWRNSRLELESILGTAITCGSVPGGFFSRNVAQAADDAGLRLLFTSEPQATPYVLGNCQIQGRFTVYRGMTPASAAALLQSPWPRWRQSAWWTTKKLAKSLGGETYIRLRERFWRQAYAAP